LAISEIALAREWNPPSGAVKMTMTMPVACAQMACATFDRRRTWRRPIISFRRLRIWCAQLILLPELLTTGYTYDRRLHDFAQPIGGATTRWLHGAAGRQALDRGRHGRGCGRGHLRQPSC